MVVVVVVVVGCGCGGVLDRQGIRWSSVNVYVFEVVVVGLVVGCCCGCGCSG